MKCRWPAFVFLGCGLVAAGRAAPAAGVEAELTQWLGEQPGGVAAALIDARGVKFYNAGKYSAADPRPITPDTQFEIGSVTKVFTALLLADTMQAGKVRLTDAVGSPFAPNRVTYEQLATHTSGLPRLPADFSRPDPLNPYDTADLSQLVRFFNEVSMPLRPASYAYSNFGFAVMGQALAGLWGEPYPELLAPRILAPLDLHDTVLSWRQADPHRLAPPHSGQEVVKNWDLNAFTPAGGLVSTTRDLAKFVQAALGLPPAPLHELFALTMQPHAPEEAGRQIGLAWNIDARGNSPVFWHNGATGGYRAFVACNPAKRRGIVLIANSTASLDALGLRLLAGRVLPAVVESTDPAENLKEYLGRYPLRPDFVIKITADGGQLFEQATAQSRLKLMPVSADRYSIDRVPAEISFERDAGGRITALVLHQNGRDQRGPKGE